MNRFRKSSLIVAGTLMLVALVHLVDSRIGYGATQRICLDHGCKRPFQTTLEFAFPDEGQTTTVEQTFLVPTGQLLVIEYASTTMVSSRVGGVNVQIGTFASGSTVFHSLPVRDNGNTTRIQDSDTNEANAGLLVRYPKNIVAGQVVRLYAEPGTVVRVTVERNSFEPLASLQVALSGHLVRVS
jgi:hypothetical protein